MNVKFYLGNNLSEIKDLLIKFIWLTHVKCINLSIIDSETHNVVVESPKFPALTNENICEAVDSYIINSSRKLSDYLVPEENLGKISLLTSGTTGTPKLIQKDLKYLFDCKKGFSGTTNVWLLTYSPSRWAGISVILHCLKNNCPIIFPKSLNSKDILSSFKDVNSLSMTPSLFKKLQMIDYNAMKEAFIYQITFGGEYCDQKTIDQAKLLWPKAKINHIYASTEIGDICSISDGKEGIPKQKLKNYELVDFELFINGISTGDLWEERSDRLFFLGRKEKVINVGGAKVMCSKVEQEANKFIFDSKVYSEKSPILGEVVCIDYIGDMQPVELKKNLLTVLPKYAVPVKINKVLEFNLKNGKK